jgi:hypothetical protein
MLFHTVAGWFFAALLLAFLYFAIFKYATKEGKQGNPPLTFKSTYLVILAAGLLHFALDFVDYASYMTPNFSGEGSYGAFQLGYENLSTGYGMPEGILSSVFPGFSGGELLLIGLLSMVILIWVLNNKKLIVVYIAAGGFILFIITILILFGGRVVYYENDLGWLIYFLFFIMFPLYLIKFSLD